MTLSLSTDRPAGHPLTVDASVSRSWLLVNGAADEQVFDDATASAADQVILDIEDAVDPASKDGARMRVAQWLDGGGSAWVRINDASTPWWQADIEVLRTCRGLAGVMLAKTEDEHQVLATAAALGGEHRIVALVESAVGIENATKIATAPGTYRLAFGSGDYRRDTGTSPDDLAMAYPRSRLVVSSRVGGLPGPIDGPTVTDDTARLRDQAALGVTLGLTGKLCLDPAHPATINEAMSPDAGDVAWAQSFLDEFAARGAVIRDGSDLPRLGHARRILSLAASFGALPPAS